MFCASQFPGEEPCYAGVPMSSIVEQGYGVGDVISLLWFKRSLPRYCTHFIEVGFSYYRAFNESFSFFFSLETCFFLLCLFSLHHFFPFPF